MFDKLLMGLGLAVVLFVVWMFVKPSFYEIPGKEQQEYQGQPLDTFIAPAISVQQHARVEPPRKVSPAGPNPPNADSEEVATLSPEVAPKDPYDMTNSENIVDTLRHPERMFSPGVKNNNTTLRVSSAVDTPSVQVTSQALQTFSPETAQNGGFFMQGISANDTQSDAEYATF
jgi:hypothetical protein